MTLRLFLESAVSNPVIVFDVNETLLDLSTLSPIFERLFGNPLALQLWFANLILYSEALTLTQSYVTFTEIGNAVLKMMATAMHRDLTSADSEELAARFGSMPPYLEVPAALRRLRSAGFRLFTLTNNVADVQRRQLQQGGILELFEDCLSVDVPAVRRHKPAPEVYAHVQRQLQLLPSQLFMVACHTWDIQGAVASGWGAALVKRPGNEVLSIGPQPTFVCGNLDDLVDQLIERYGRPS
jgi:2-haloacid dehalogenase